MGRREIRREKLSTSLCPLQRHNLDLYSIDNIYPIGPDPSYSCTEGHQCLHSSWVLLAPFPGYCRLSAKHLDAQEGYGNSYEPRVVCQCYMG